MEKEEEHSILNLFCTTERRHVRQELLKAVENSPRSFDEIMDFLKEEE